jgi:hypothetical protein
MGTALHIHIGSMERIVPIASFRIYPREQILISPAKRLGWLPRTLSSASTKYAGIKRMKATGIRMVSVSSNAQSRQNLMKMRKYVIQSAMKTRDGISSIKVVCISSIKSIKAFPLSTNVVVRPSPRLSFGSQITLKMLKKT